MSDIQQGPDWWLATDGRWYPPAAPAQSDEVDAVDKTPAIGLIVSGCLAALGSTMPWATLTAPFVGQVDVRGTSGDGRITLLLGLALATQGLLLLTGKRGGDRLWVAVHVAGLIVAAIGIYNYINLTDSDGSSEYVGVSVGPGVYLVALGGVGAVVSASVRGFRRDPRTLAASSEAEADERNQAHGG